MPGDVLIQLTFVLVLGIAAQWGAWRLRFPSVLLLLATGIVAGPVTGFLHPEQLFGKLLLPVVSLSVAIIIVGISVAGNIAFKFLGARVGFEVVLVSPDIVASVLPPLGATALLMTAVCLVLYLRRPTLETEIPAEEAPLLDSRLSHSAVPEPQKRH